MAATADKLTAVTAIEAIAVATASSVAAMMTGAEPAAACDPTDVDDLPF